MDPVMIILIVLVALVLFSLVFLLVKVVKITGDQRRADNDKLIMSVSSSTSKWNEDDLSAPQEYKGYAQKLHQAGIRMSTVTWMLLVSSVAFTAFFIVMLVFGNPIVPLVVLPSIYLLSDIIVRARVKKQHLLFEEQFGRACTQIAGSIRTGMSIDRAIRSVAAYMDDPLRSEFMIVAAECTYDPDVAAALKRMALRMESSDALLFASMIDLNQRRGGKLADSVERLAETISTRQAMRRHVRAESSNGKLTGHAVLGLTIFIVLFMVVGNANYLEFYRSNPLGWACLAIAGILFAIGAYIMAKMTDYKMD